MEQNKIQYKHRNCIIELTPTEQYKEMVTIISTPAIRKDFEGRRYLTLEHAHKQIEKFESERLIKSKEKYVKKQLKEVVVLDAFSLMRMMVERDTSVSPHER